VAACEAIPGLRGYVGVDLVLSDTDAVLIEINPRLTTAYVGLRRALEQNVAALIVDACAGSLPAPPRRCRHVRFTAAGRVSGAGR
jgi:predicted ATP-grasp superfamily ATP-dependent carboligase